MNNQISGTIHGKTILLSEDPGLTEGQTVTVILQATTEAEPGRVWGDGIRASAGAFADWPEAERVMEEILAARRVPSRREIPE